MRPSRYCEPPDWQRNDRIMNFHPPFSSFPAPLAPVAAQQAARGFTPSKTVARRSVTARSLFVEELELLAKLAAFRPDLRLVVGRSGSEFSFDWGTGTISIDGGRIRTESADFIRGLVLHESAHAAITRLQAIVPLVLLKDRQLFALLNVLEDCRIETWMQIRFPGCQPWVREYNDRLFGPIMAADVPSLPVAQFLNGILTRWWFGKASEPMGEEACRALESVWPAIERVLLALPPQPDRLGDVSAAYARNPVSRCYMGVDDHESPGAFEQAVRIAQYQAWAIIHQQILPTYLRLLPPQDDLGKSWTAHLSLLQEAMPDHHLLGNLSPASLRVTLPSAGLPLRGPVEPALTPAGYDSYLQSWNQQQEAIEVLAEGLLRWFQAHGKTRFRHGCPWGSRLNLGAAMRFEADLRLYDQLWSRPLTPERIDPHFSLVIDRSGSMRGERIEQSFHGVVLLCEVCRRVGVPLNVYSFGSRAERLLHHDEPLSADVRARLGELPKSARGGTNLTAALECVAGDVRGAPFQDRFVFVLSDGVPDNADSARKQITLLAQDGVSMVGLGLGQQTLRLQELLPVSRVNLSSRELPGALASLLVSSLRGR